MLKCVKHWWSNLFFCSPYFCSSVLLCRDFIKIFSRCNFMETTLDLFASGSRESYSPEEVTRSETGGFGENLWVVCADLKSGSIVEACANWNSNVYRNLWHGCAHLVGSSDVCFWLAGYLKSPFESYFKFLGYARSLWTHWKINAKHYSSFFGILIFNITEKFTKFYSNVKWVLRTHRSFWRCSQICNSYY